jgi:hypothetical protein
MFDKDNCIGFEYNEDLLYKELYGVKRDLSYIDITDEIISWMYMYAFEEEMNEWLSDGCWEQGQWTLDESIWQESDMYLIDGDQFLDIPIIDQDEIIEEVDEFIWRAMK